MDVLEWAEKAATTLTVLLAGIAGALTYTVKYAEQGGARAMMAGCAAVAAWLMVLAFILLHRCIRTRNLEPPTNEPETCISQTTSWMNFDVSS